MYLTGGRLSGEEYEKLVEVAEEAAIKVLDKHGVTYDQAMLAECKRVNDEEYEAGHAEARDAAVSAAKKAVYERLTPTAQRAGNVDVEMGQR